MIHLFIHDNDLLENKLIDFLSLFDRNTDKFKIWLNSQLLSDMEIQDELLEQKLDDVHFWQKNSYQQANTKYWAINHAENPFSVLQHSCLSEILERVRHQHFGNHIFFIVRLTESNTNEYVLKTSLNPEVKPDFHQIDCINLKNLNSILIILAKYDESIKNSLLDTAEKVWQNKDIFENLIFCDKIKAQLNNFSGDSLKNIVNALSELNIYCFEWKKENSMFDYKNKLKNVTPESTKRLRDFEQELNVLCPDNITREFNLHFKLTPGAIRIHFFPNNENHKCIIGNIGNQNDIK
jgi:hypothetical protein